MSSVEIQIRHGEKETRNILKNMTSNTNKRIKRKSQKETRYIINNHILNRRKMRKQVKKYLVNVEC